MRLQEDIQKTLNGDVKDLPKVSVLDKVDLSVDDLIIKLQTGAYHSIEGIIDFLIDGVGTIGTLFGASDDWAKKAREFDITSWLQDINQ